MKDPGQFKYQTLAGELLAKRVSQAQKWRDQNQTTEVESICLIRKMLSCMEEVRNWN